VEAEQCKCERLDSELLRHGVVCATEVCDSTLGRGFIRFSNTTEEEILFSGLKLHKVI
jgi:hypothetical protein